MVRKRTLRQRLALEAAMKKSRDQPTSVEAALFRQALEGVTPLTPDNRSNASPPRKHSRNSLHPATQIDISDTLTDPGIENDPLVEFMRPGVSRMTLRKLKRGHWPVQDSLDLHGLHSDAARKLLLQFMRDATQLELRCVRVIHGKGWHTDGGEGILKIRSRHWLTQCKEVMAFCETPPQEGGGGAVRILLKISTA